MMKLFRTDREITDPADPAYLDIYDDYAGNIKPYKLANFEPAVICSPRKTGKTTHVFNLRNIRKRFEESPCESIIKIEDENMSEEKFQELLKNKLQSEQSDTFSDILKTSHKMRNQGSSFLAIIDSHRLPIDTLRWLLYGISRLNDRENIPAQHKVQIAIDGNFAMDTLTSGPNSEFPMPQLYPREFNRNEQESFINNRLKKLGLQLDKSANRTIWEVTNGDKYFTQALSLRLLRQVERSKTHKIVIKNHEVFHCIEKYIEESPFEDELKPDLFHSFFQISTFCRNEGFNIEGLLEKINKNWTRIPREIRAIAYDGGLVRRKNESEIELRAPIVMDFLKPVESKARQIRSLLGAFFSLESVRGDYYEIANNCLNEIIKATYMSCLKTLHIGFGHKTSPEEISINAAAFGHGNYQGSWKVRTDDSISIGDEVWGILWSYENEKGAIEGHLKVFPVHI